MSSSMLLKITIIYLTFLFCSACNADSLEGEWLDNGTGVTRIGDLKITEKTIAITNRISYTVAQKSTNGSSTIYKVSGINRKADPFGCGPDSKSHYIIIQPLPDIAGSRQQAIRLLFYGLPTMPDLKEIDDNPAVCAVYSFSRKQ